MIRHSARPPQRFDRHGFLAIDPKAFFELFFVPATRANTRVDQVDVIEVSGPLVQRDEMWCDSYEAIRARVREACESDSRAIVMRFDSPGGDASGCFETARAIRDEVTKANKPLIAYVDKACSAAYALASAAHRIVIGETCCAGSVGVLSSRPDYTAMNSQRGVRMAFTVSGARKLDGNPDYPITEAELNETQRHVDDLALKFFALIEDQRPQLSAASVAGFDGAVFYGNGAVDSGLADNVATFEETLAYAGTEDPMSIFQNKLSAKSASDYDGARALLEKAAKGTDANAAAAKRALAAMAEAEPAKEEPDKEPDSEGDDKEPDAEGDDKEPDAEGDDKEPKSEGDDEPPADDKKPKTIAPAAAASSTELELAARVHKLEAKAQQDAQARERAALIAKRPDFGPELRAALAKAPIGTVRDMVKTLPKGAVPKREPLTTVAAQRGVTQGDSLGGGTPTRLSGADANELDRAMGFSVPKLGSRREGSTMFFGHVKDGAADDTQTTKSDRGQP